MNTNNTNNSDNNNNDISIIPLTLHMRATAKLDKELEEELKEEDPDSEQAKAVFNNEC